MENETLIKLFLVIIAAGALLQTAVVAGLVVGARLLNRKVGELERAVDAEVLPRLDSLADLAGRVTEYSEEALADAERLGASIAQTASRVSATVGGAADRVASTAGSAVGRMEEAFEAGSRAARRPVRRSRAILKGLRRGFEVWRHGAQPARDY